MSGFILYDIACSIHLYSGSWIISLHNHDGFFKSFLSCNLYQLQSGITLIMLQYCAIIGQGVAVSLLPFKPHCTLFVHCACFKFVISLP